MLLNPKTPLAFGLVATAALAGYLFMRHPLPGPLSRAHAQVVPGIDIYTCRRCHADEGLTAGCLACHTEIAAQLDTEQGYHAFLSKDEKFRCARCHLEHQGRAFPLVSALSWPAGDPNTFDHPHCDYQLTGSHDQLACAACHEDERTQAFSLPDFPEHMRTSTFLGLSQDCVACHVDVHAWPSEKPCLDCHNQMAFDPAALFHHDDVFVLEGVHAETNCAECHPRPAEAPTEKDELVQTPGALPFHQVTGETCEQCHPTPHRTTWEAGCETCHLGRDVAWHEGTRGVDVATHEPTGFALTGDHTIVSCAECHPQDQDYAQRYPDPTAAGYQRHLETCQGCHDDVHAGKMDHTCITCHQTNGWTGADLLFEHDRDTAFALDTVHRRLACQDCHPADDLTYPAAGTECQDCHEVQANALRGQARHLQMDPDPHFNRVACIDCHDMNVPTQSMASHAQRCAECHNDQYAPLAYRWAETLQQQRTAVQRLVAQRPDLAAEGLQIALQEAEECGLHHVQLTRRLYDRLLESRSPDERRARQSEREGDTWTRP